MKTDQTIMNIPSEDRDFIKKTVSSSTIGKRAEIKTLGAIQKAIERLNESIERITSAVYQLAPERPQAKEYIVKTFQNTDCIKYDYEIMEFLNTSDIDGIEQIVPHSDSALSYITTVIAYRYLTK